MISTNISIHFQRILSVVWQLVRFAWRSFVVFPCVAFCLLVLSANGFSFFELAKTVIVSEADQAVLGSSSREGYIRRRVCRDSRSPVGDAPKFLGCKDWSIEDVSIDSEARMAGKIGIALYLTFGIVGAVVYGALTRSE